METKIRNNHPILSTLIIVCGLLYIFAYQFKLPFKADLFLFGMLVGLVLTAFLDGRILISRQAILAILTAMAGITGLFYTSMWTEGLREAILFVFFSGLCVLSLTTPALIISFTNWTYFLSIAVVFSSIVHFMAPEWFNALMRQVLRSDAYSQLMWSYTVDSAYSGFSAYTPNTTFSAAIVFGTSFLHLIGEGNPPIFKNKLLNIALMVLSLFSIILCSKRGIFVATIAALFILMFFLYKGTGLFAKLLCVSLIFIFCLMILYFTNDLVAAFLNRFISGDFMTGRDVIYSSLMEDFWKSNFMTGRGTGAAYAIAQSGAHNIYLQILYDHGFILSLPDFNFCAIHVPCVWIIRKSAVFQYVYDDLYLLRFVCC